MLPDTPPPKHDRLLVRLGSGSRAAQDLLGMPDSIEEFELDMLELAKEYDKDPDASRLSCQIILSEELEGITVHLPSGHINYMDPIPFE